MMFGDLRVDLIPTGRFRLDGGAMFGVVPRVLWERVTPPDEKHRVELALNCLLVRDGRQTTLVETGMGDKWASKEREIYAFRDEPGLVAGLSGLGVAPESIDSVILTHLHFDHAGGSTSRDANGELRATFPNAVYYVQRSEWEFAKRPNERTQASYRTENFEPLWREGRMRLVEGEAEIGAGVSVMPLPGHTPGLQGGMIRGGGKVGWYPSDLIPTAAHLPYPYIMGYDVLPLTTLETKKHFLPRAVREGWVLLLVHEPTTPVGMLKETEGGRVILRPWEGRE